MTSAGYKSSNRNKRFGNHKTMTSKSEKHLFATVREVESENNRGFQLEIIVDSEASGQVVTDELCLTDVEEITLVTVKLASGTLITATKRGIVELDVRRPRTVFCRAYCIPKIILHLLSCLRLEDHGVTTTFGLGKCRIVDRDENNLVIGTLHKPKVIGCLLGE